ncbi:MAG TPA: HNH endonuclease [Gaiellaceae bacterium]
MPLVEVSGVGVRGCPLGGWPPRPLSARREKLRLQLADVGAGLSRTEDGARAAFALAAAYRGEQSVVLSFGAVARVREGAVAKLLQEAAWLLQPWGREGRIELRCLRPAVRRALLSWVAGRRDLTLVVAGRRAIVLAPTDPGGVVEEIGGNRRRMLMLAARDGEHCVWCSKQLSHRDGDATVDHVRCRSDGGGNGLDNLVLACASCNHRRSNAPAEEWLARCLAAGAEVDADAVAAAIRRSGLYHRRRLRRALLPVWDERAAA